MLTYVSEMESARSRGPVPLAIPVAESSFCARRPNHNTWSQPDLSVLRLDRRPPPALPLTVLGPAWGPGSSRRICGSPQLATAAPRVATLLAMAAPRRPTMACSRVWSGLGRSRSGFGQGARRRVPNWGSRALDLLRELDLRPGDPPWPIIVPLTREARR